MCVGKFGIKGKLKVIERPAFLITLLPEIHDLFQNTFQHIIFCLCVREGVIDLKQIFDFRNNCPLAFFLFTQGGQLIRESFNPVLCLGDTHREVTGAVEESISIVHALFQ